MIVYNYIYRVDRDGHKAFRHPHDERVEYPRANRDLRQIENCLKWQNSILTLYNNNNMYNICNHFLLPVERSENKVKKVGR